MTRERLISVAISNLHKHWPKGVRRSADNKQIAALAITEAANKHMAAPVEGDWLKVSQREARNAMADAYRNQSHAVSMSAASHRRGSKGTSKAAASVIAHAPLSLDSPDTPEPVTDTISKSDNRILLEQLMAGASLTFDLREMLALRYGLNGEPEHSLEAIATRYGCSVSTAQKRIERALARLREAAR